MILCNPNAATYEYLNLLSEFFNYYKQLGFNLVIWNYPGYGRVRSWFISVNKV